MFSPIAAFILGVNVTPALAEEVSTPATTGIDAEISDLRKIEDGSVISNIHTSKWRVFTDSGRDLFLQACRPPMLSLILCIFLYNSIWWSYSLNLQ